MEETVEVKLLNYSFLFRALTWREELSIKYPEKEDRRRVILGHALHEVSGLPVKTADEGLKLMKALPEPVIARAFIVYRGSLALPRIFTTTGLFQAPLPNRVAAVFEAEEQKREEIMDKVEAEMAAKFGRKELMETREIERQMLKNSKMRGATKPSPDLPPEKN
jgi:hypothetical protein